MNRPLHPLTTLRRHAQAGLTLVELMVALLLSLVLAAAVLAFQLNTSKARMRTSDVALRDNEARAALDLVTRELSSAGFLFGGSHLRCSAIMTYNSGLSGNYFTHRQVTALAASAGTVMTFGTGLTLNYPVAGSTIPSDVLVVTQSRGAAAFGDAARPVTAATVNAAALPMTAASVPVANAAGITAGNVGLLMVVDSGQKVCMRMPFGSTGTSAGVPWVATPAASPYMPATYFSGFGGKWAAAGIKGTLSNAEIYIGRVISLGSAAAAANLVTTAFYIDNNGGSYPTLMRARYNLLDDSVVEAPQPVAAGVVSLQVRYGVDLAGTGTASAYESAATVSASQHWDLVRSARVALVTRSLYDDSTFTNTAASITPEGAGFTAVPIEAGSHRRYVAQVTEMAVRNKLW